mgnify:CR=1 FL=1
MKSYGLTIFLYIILLVLLSLSACGGDDSAADGDSDEETEGALWDGVCTEERSGWEKCDSNRIQWCHVVEGMEAHFHEGLNCEALSLTCVEHELEEDGAVSYRAFCVDESMTCGDGEFACSDNTAQNCIDGVMALEPCGTKHCHEEADEAVCEYPGDEECGGHGQLVDETCQCDENYETDPEDATNCISTLSFPEMACRIFNEQKDSVAEEHHLDATDSRPGPHAHLYEVMEVHLLAANASNYMHFPVMETGEYVMFLDTAGVVANIYDKDGNEVPFTNPGPNGKCADVLVDHFHISGTYTGDGSSPEPAIVEFQVTEDTEVKLLVLMSEEEHEHE